MSLVATSSIAAVIVISALSLVTETAGSVLMIACMLVIYSLGYLRGIRVVEQAVTKELRQ